MTSEINGVRVFERVIRHIGGARLERFGEILMLGLLLKNFGISEKYIGIERPMPIQAEVWNPNDSISKDIEILIGKGNGGEVI